MDVEELTSRTEALIGDGAGTARLLILNRRGDLTHVRVVVAPRFTASLRAPHIHAVLAMLVEQRLKVALAGRATAVVEHRPDRVVVGLSCLPDDLREVVGASLSALRVRIADIDEALSARDRVAAIHEKAEVSPMTSVRARFLDSVHAGRSSDSDVRTLSGKRLVEELSAALVDENVMLAVVGSLSAADIEGLKRLLRASPPYGLAPYSVHQPESGIIHESDESLVQDMVRVGCATVGRGHRDYAAVQIGALAFGGFPLSRLTRRLRETERLAYAPRAFLDPSLGYSTFGLEMDVRRGQGAHALSAAMEEFSGLLEDYDGFELAKSYAVGAMQISCSSASGYASVLAGLQALRLPIAWLQRYEQSIQALDFDSVRLMQNWFFAE
ncbi:hypothetical protein A6122_2065 [Rathayibacter tritici]|uniref:Peptidase M16 C-terminal domain-containing protein n=2 Tax=Rathayibacter tritici TaxID=33888 RepID=A0A160KUC9_9MICO|nr:hypothetical protein A6122_2065 [Rathayibacter tritici]